MFFTFHLVCLLFTYLSSLSLALHLVLSFSPFCTLSSCHLTSPFFLPPVTFFTSTLSFITVAHTSPCLPHTPLSHSISHSTHTTFSFNFDPTYTFLCFPPFHCSLPHAHFCTLLCTFIRFNYCSYLFNGSHISSILSICLLFLLIKSH